jgi:hypothetical protein
LGKYADRPEGGIGVMFYGVVSLSQSILVNERGGFIVYRLALIFMISLILNSCITVISGTVSTAKLAEPPPNHKFIVVVKDQMDLTGKIIAELIEHKMIDHGYTKASSLETANVEVLFNYSIGTGQTVVSSHPDYSQGGQQVVASRTRYPQFFQIAIVDLSKPKTPDKLEIIWQGEVHSSGSSSNMSELAGPFLDELFENYGNTVTNKTFYELDQ